MADSLSLEFVDRHPAEAARVLEGFSKEDVSDLLSDLPAASAGRLLAHLNASVASRCLETLDEPSATAALETLPVATAILLLARLDRRRRSALVAAQPPPRRAAMQLVLRYPSGTVGSVMDPAAVTVRERMTVAEAIGVAQQAPGALRKYLYVVDDANRIRGTLDVRQCLIAPRESTVGSHARKHPVALRARVSLEEAARSSGWRRFEILPVVGRDDAFLGVLRRRTLDRMLADGSGRAPNDLPDTFIELAEFYWNASAGIVLGSGDGMDPRGTRRDER